MTIRDLLRWVGILAVLEGVALLIGGHRAMRLLERVTRWNAAWPQRFLNAPESVTRAYGVITAALGLRMMAMAPPLPPPVAWLAGLGGTPLRALWSATVARQAERAYDRLLNEFVPPGARVLDLGCADGDNLARILREGLIFGSYLGLDPSPERLARARARFTGLPKVDFLVNDLDQDQLPTGEFDLILCTWAMGWIPDPTALTVRAVRQLRHGGRAILMFVSPVNDWRSGLIGQIARISGRTLRTPSRFDGLPPFTAAERYAGGLISIVILEAPEPIETVIRPQRSEASGLA